LYALVLNCDISFLGGEYQRISRRQPPYASRLVANVSMDRVSLLVGLISCSRLRRLISYKPLEQVAFFFFATYSPYDSDVVTLLTKVSETEGGFFINPRSFLFFGLMGSIWK